jgi:hypothetical protein
MNRSLKNTSDDNNKSS